MNSTTPEEGKHMAKTEYKRKTSTANCSEVLSRQELVSKLDDTTEKAKKAQKIKSMQKNSENEMIKLKEEQAIKAIFF